MEGLLIGLLLLGSIFVSQNKEFLDTVDRQKEEGYTWHYVGPTDLDPNAKHMALQCYDDDLQEYCGEPYILWKLKK